jgi:hypothetical protein
MKRIQSCTVRGRRGFTLLETTVSLGVFLVLSYSLVVTLDMATDSQSAVTARSSEVRSARATHAHFADELRQADPDDVLITQLADGNHEVSFRQPIMVGGAAVWGVFDISLGANEDERSREDWRVRYTVESASENGVTVRTLVRQIIDDAGDFVSEQTVARGLNSGTLAAPGFQVTRVGDVWRVQLGTVQHGSDSCRKEDFHVGSRT